MTETISIETLHPAAARAAIADLATVLMDSVAGGASVGFMNPLSRDRAEAFWRGVADGVAAGERLLIVARLNGEIVGAVQVVLAMPENQPHRGDLAKMLVRGDARRRGLGGALMRAAEAAARAAGKTLLVLDTASDEAMRVYQRAGWVRVGIVPDFALWPDGGFCDTVIYYKRLA